MLENALTVINFGLLLFFGIYVSAAFLNIEQNKRNHLVFISFGLMSYAVQGIVSVLLGMKYAEMLYPLITHLPLLLLFVLYFRQKALPSLFAVLSAYLCCQVSLWFSLLAVAVIDELWFMYAVRIAITIPIWYVIVRNAAKPMQVILSKSAKTILIFGIMPSTYYLFDYITTVFTGLLYSGAQVVYEFLPFLLCIAYLIFNVIYFQEYEEKRAAEQQKRLIELQTVHSLKEIEEIKRSGYEVSLLRHDMRHFLSNIWTMIESKEYGNAQAYIRSIIDVADRTVMRRYCANEMINTVLVSYGNRMGERNIRFDADVNIPDKLPCAELEFTTILANGLENAINAAAEMEGDKRWIDLKLHMKDNKLLLSIRNHYLRTPVFKNGLPVTSAAGHGLGTQSIRYMAAKLNGHCQFTAKDGVFSLRVVCHATP